VLEVGCGNGINLLLLAGSFPEIEFAGIELTDTGHRAARELQSAGVLPRHISDYAPLPQMDGSAFQRIEFLQGDATGMPFADGAFDLVFTILSVEQMERVRDAALREIARVSSRFVLNLEPFANANRSGWKRLNVYGRDYFRGRIADLPRYGLNPLWATMDYPQEIILGTALVLSRKTN
jgi:SAM-dependent methyltransferase